MKLLATTKQWQQAVDQWQGIKDAPAKQNRPFQRGFKVMENDFLEKYVATAHWSLPLLWAIPAMLYLLIKAFTTSGYHPGTIALLFIAGAASWTLLEYWLHRWLFHLPPSRNPILRNIQFTLHGYHHEFPEDPGRLVAPLILAVPIFLLVSGFTAFCFPVVWPAILAGLFFGYLCYDSIHYYSHHGRQRTAAGKFMRRFHMEHHYKHANSQYGLSSPLWDLVFRSYRRPSAPAKTEQACLCPANAE